MYYPWLLGTAIAVLTLGLIVAWSRRNRWLRWAVVVTAVSVMPAAYFTANDLLSRPKPMQRELVWAHVQKAEVKGFHAVAGVGLYMLLKFKELEEPRYYFYEWSEDTREMIRQLQDAWESAQKNGMPLFMLKPFERSIAPDKPIFQHPDPPTAPTPKPSVPQPKQFSA